MKRLTFIPIHEDEGLSWEQLCDRLDALPKPKPEQSLLFDEGSHESVAEQTQKARGPPPVSLLAPQIHAPFSALTRRSFRHDPDQLRSVVRPARRFR